MKRAEQNGPPPEPRITMAAVAERRELEDAGVAEMQEGMEDLELAGPIPIQQLQVRSDCGSSKTGCNIHSVG